MKTVTTLLITILVFQLNAQERFPKEEFAARREKLFSKIGNGIGVIWGRSSQFTTAKFTQAPDLYYLTGIKDEHNAILLLIGATKQVFFFSRKPSDLGIDPRYTEGSIWDSKNPREEYGLKLMPYEDFWDLISFFNYSGNTIYLPLTPIDYVEGDRSEVDAIELETLHHPIKSIPMWKQAIATIKEVLPSATLQNINPLLDELRLIKTAYEIEQFKISCKIGAEGVLEAIKDTKPGMFEYELEATASYFYTKRGARGVAFAPIVASGTNTYSPHYQKNDRRIQKEDFVLMDYGCYYNYYTSDVTRVWPASGKFSADEEKMYLCVLEARDEIIKAMKPGVSFKDLKNILFNVYSKHGFTDKKLSLYGYLGHFVGLSVHEGAADDNIVLKSGMVFNVEPVLDNPERRIHMRLEDTVLVTDTGAINLTASAPAGLEEIYKLIKQKGLSEN